MGAGGLWPGAAQVALRAESGGRRPIACTWPAVSPARGPGRAAGGKGRSRGSAADRQAGRRHRGEPGDRLGGRGHARRGGRGRGGGGARPGRAGSGGRAAARHQHRVLAVAADTTDDARGARDGRTAAAETGRGRHPGQRAAQPRRPGAPRRLAELTDDDLRAEIETKVLGYLRTARAARAAHGRAGLGAHHQHQRPGRPLRPAAPFGSIRNVAVAALTKNLADELGPAGHQRHRRPPRA